MNSPTPEPETTTALVESSRTIQGHARLLIGANVGAIAICGTLWKGASGAVPDERWIVLIPAVHGLSIWWLFLASTHATQTLNGSFPNDEESEARFRRNFQLGLKVLLIGCVVDFMIFIGYELASEAVRLASKGGGSLLHHLF